MTRTAALTILTALVLTAGAAHAALGDLFGETSERPIEFRFVASHTTIEPGATLLVAITTTIPEGYHLQDQISLVPDEAAPFTLGKSWHSPLKVRTIGTSEYLEYVGEFVALYELRVGPDAPHGPHTVPLTFVYQPCSEQVCFGRREAKADIAITIGAPAAGNVDFEPFREKIALLVAAEEAEEPLPPTSGKGKAYVEKYALVGKPNVLFFGADGEELARIVGYRGQEKFYEQVRAVAGGTVEPPKERSLPLWLGLALVGGLLAAFSPCVYPMIPITMGYLADQAGPKFSRNLVMTLMLGLGIVLPLALVGAFIGGLQDVLYNLASNVIYILVLDVVLILLMASMLGAFEIQLPAALRNKAAGGQSAAGPMGAFVIGLVVLPLAFACTAPALGLIIPFIVGKAVGTAMLVMVVFGLGLALPYLAIGTFAGALGAMPRSGAWMLGIKKLFALLLVGVIFYISRPLTDTFPAATGMLAGAAFVALAIGLGVFRKSLKSAFNRGVGVVALALGVYFAVGSVLVESGKVEAFPLQSIVRYPAAREAAFTWRHDLEAAFDEAKRENKLVMAYFWGYNCIACTEYALYVWPKPEAAEALEDFVPVKINLDE